MGRALEIAALALMIIVLIIAAGSLALALMLPMAKLRQRWNERGDRGAGSPTA